MTKGTKYTAEIPEMEISIKSDGITHKRNLKEDITIDDPNKINEYLVQNPGKTAFWNMRFQEVKVAVQRAKIQMETYYAKLDGEFRKKAESDNITLRESEIKHLIILDDKYQKLQDNYLDLQESEGILRAAVEAMKDLRDALRTLAANYRLEYNSGIKLQDKYEANYSNRQPNREPVEEFDDKSINSLRKRFGG